MKLKMFAPRDSKISAFLRPFFAQTTPEALRVWTDSVNDDRTGFKKHPEDYALFEVGAFDSVTGMVETLAQPLHLAGAEDVLQPNEITGAKDNLHSVFPVNQPN